MTFGLLRNVRVGSVLCADGAKAWSAAAAAYPSKRLTVKHVNHVPRTPPSESSKSSKFGGLTRNQRN